MSKKSQSTLQIGPITWNITDRDESVSDYILCINGLCHSIPTMNSRYRATNITSYIHVCTIAITRQMVVNFLENNVRTKNLRAELDVFFEIILSDRADQISQRILVPDQIFQDQ